MREAHNFKNQPIYTLIMPHIQKKVQKTQDDELALPIQGQSCLQQNSNFEMFSKNLSGAQISQLFHYFFVHISGSTGPILLIFELSLTN